MIVKTMLQKLMIIIDTTKIKQVCYSCLFIVYSLAMSVSAQNVVQDATEALTFAEKISVAQLQAKAKLQYQVKFKARDDNDIVLTADYRFLPNKASVKYMSGGNSVTRLS
ncbi:MAG: hypothetical protein ACI9VL_001418 [Colwellia sp.]|jgi:hypothetical protein